MQWTWNHCWIIIGERERLETITWGAEVLAQRADWRTELEESINLRVEWTNIETWVISEWANPIPKSNHWDIFNQNWNKKWLQINEQRSHKKKLLLKDYVS